MFDQIVQVSEAFRESASQMRLMPALMGCPECRTTHMIAAPALGTCVDCGSSLKVLAPDSE